jgi:uncharacterized membrane protein YtjA (UPF0391 family)
LTRDKAKCPLTHILDWVVTSEPTLKVARSEEPGMGRERPAGQVEENDMLYYAAVFLVIALIAAVFGFGGIAAGAVGIAKILFFIFVVLFVVSLLMGLMRRG